MHKRFYLLALCLGWMASIHAQENLPAKKFTPQKTVMINSHAFAVTVEPLNQASADASTADLYMTRTPGSGWNRVGACAIRRVGGKPEFTCHVRVPLDGTYFFTSIAGDEIGKTAPPTPDAPAQARVIVDTVAPSVHLSAPFQNETLRCGDLTRVDWIASDEHFSLKPIRLSFSTDNGASWQPIGTTHYNDGNEKWLIPALTNKKLRLRVEAQDEAGNTASAETRVRLLTPKEKQSVPSYTLGSTDTPKTFGSRPVNAGESAVKSGYRLASASGDDLHPMVGRELQPTTGDAAIAADTDTAADANAGTTATTNNTAENDNATAADDDAMVKTVARSVMAARAAWLKAGNMVRQGRHKDAIRYYSTAVRLDPLFDEAWSDMSMVYRYLGLWDEASKCIARALRLRPEEPQYLHNRGEIAHARGMSLQPNLLDPKTNAERKNLLRQAMDDYQNALETANRQGRTAERAETFYRMGEICFYATQDYGNARIFWEKILDLHAPTPELDTVMHDKNTPQYEEALRAYSRETAQRSSLDHWKMWAQEKLGLIAQAEEKILAAQEIREQKRRATKGSLLQKRGRVAWVDVPATCTTCEIVGEPITTTTTYIVDETAAPQTTDAWEPTGQTKTPAYLEQGYGTWADDNDPTARR